MNKMIGNKKGFTLIELIVTLSIMGFILSSISAFLVFNMKAFNNAEQQAEAQNQAQAAINGFVNRCIETKGVRTIVFDADTGAPSLSQIDLIKENGIDNIRFNLASNIFQVTEAGITQDLASNIESIKIQPIPTSVICTDPACRGLKVDVVSKVNNTRTTLTSEVYFRNR